MIRVTIACIILVFVSACSSIRVENVTQVSKEEIFDEIKVVKDQETRESVLPVIEDYFVTKGYKVTIVDSSADVEPSDYAIEYRAWWTWDLALYMSKAHIKMLRNGAIVGNVSYEGKGGLNTNKWGDADRRIRIMLDTLLNEVSVDEANRRIQ